MQMEKLHNQVLFFFFLKPRVQIFLKISKSLFSLNIKYFVGVYPAIFAILYPTNSPERSIFLELTSFFWNFGCFGC